MGTICDNLREFRAASLRCDVAAGRLKGRLLTREVTTRNYSPVSSTIERSAEWRHRIARSHSFSHCWFCCEWRQQQFSLLAPGAYKLAAAAVPFRRRRRRSRARARATMALPTVGRVLRPSGVSNCSIQLFCRGRWLNCSICAAEAKLACKGRRHERSSRVAARLGTPPPAGQLGRVGGAPQRPPSAARLHARPTLHIVPLPNATPGGQVGARRR